MAATKITAYSAITQIDPAVDVGVIVDVSDTSMAASGTDKKFTLDFMNYAGISAIRGLELAPIAAGGSSITINAGKAGVNGKSVSFSQTTYASGSTMKDISNSTVTLAANSAYFVFLSDAGVIGVEINDGTGDGQTPVLDTTYGYHKAASTGAAWRRIVKFWTTASAQVVASTQTSIGLRHRVYNITDCESLPFVNGVAQASYTPITITPYITGDDAEMLIGIGTAGVGAGTAQGTQISNDGGTGQIAVLYIAGTIAGNGVMSDLKITVPNTGTLHYKTLVSANAYVFLMGYSQFV